MIRTRKPWLIFIAANVLLLGIAGFWLLAPQFDQLAFWSERITVLQRQLEVKEQNLANFAENAALLAALQAEEIPGLGGLDPTGHLLEETRQRLQRHGLREQTFRAEAQAAAEVLTETRTYLVVEGERADILAFLQELSGLDYHRISRIQLNLAPDYDSLTLQFSLYTFDPSGH